MDGPLQGRAVKQPSYIWVNRRGPRATLNQKRHHPPCLRALRLNLAGSEAFAENAWRRIYTAAIIPPDARGLNRDDVKYDT